MKCTKRKFVSHIENELSFAILSFCILNIGHLLRYCGMNRVFYILLSCMAITIISRLGRE